MLLTCLDIVILISKVVVLIYVLPVRETPYRILSNTDVAKLLNYCPL